MEVGWRGREEREGGEGGREGGEGEGERSDERKGGKVNLREGGIDYLHRI